MISSLFASADRVIVPIGKDFDEDSGGPRRRARGGRERVAQAIDVKKC